MKKFNEWTHNFSEQVDGLEYEYPFAVGDYVITNFTSESDELRILSERYVMKVIQVGVPIQTITQLYYRDVFGDLVSQGTKKGDIVEGVRTQLLYYKAGVYGDMGHGYKENFPVSMLKKVNRPANVMVKSVMPKFDRESMQLFEKAKYESKRRKYGWD